MALAIDITDGSDLSNEVGRELLLKKSKVMLTDSNLMIGVMNVKTVKLSSLSNFPAIQ